jgi:SAM-dependent methyltransferase
VAEIYQAANAVLLHHIAQGRRKVLDIGCGTGALGKLLKSDNSRHVTGVTFSKREAEVAAGLLDDVVVWDLNDGLPRDLGTFDCIITSHVLEHLVQPEHLLQQLAHHLTRDGQLLVALPNVLYWRERTKFALGSFEYTDGGLLDRTHLRFYDFLTAQSLLRQSGWEVVHVEADGHFPLPGIRRAFPRLSKRIDTVGVRLLPGLLGFQFILDARPLRPCAQ